MHPAALRRYVQRLQVPEMRATILADPHWPRAPFHLTDAEGWRERDARAERQVSDEKKRSFPWVRQ